MAEISEKHRNKLESICRLCRGKIKSLQKNVTTAEQYSNQIKKIFSYDITDDISSIHPSFICDSCRRRLDHLIKINVPVVHQQIATFSEHTDNCKLCFTRYGLLKHSFSVRKTYYPSSKDEEYSEEEKLDISQIIAYAKSKGFTIYENDIPDSDFPTCNIIYRTFVENTVTIDLSIHLFNDFSWRIYLHNKNISKSSSAVIDFEASLNYKNFRYFIDSLSESMLCSGNNDFVALVEDKLKNGTDLFFYGEKGQKRAQIQAQYPSFEIEKYPTIRAVNCEYLTNNSNKRCNSCQSYRSVLNVRLQRLSQRKDTLSKYKPNTYMSREEQQQKLQSLQKDKINLSKKVKRLENRVMKLVKSESIIVENEDANSLLSNVVSSTINPVLNKDSPKHLLWEQQKKICGLSNKSAMRWHPLLIRWCLSIYLRSPGAYEHIRSSGFLELPHRTTLNKYTAFTDVGTGFNPDVFHQFLSNIDHQNLTKADRQVAIVFDEMKIKSGLVFNKATGKVIGFTELGDMNEELNEFDRKVTTQQIRDIATHVICIMVRGLIKRYNFPIGYFASKGFDSVQLYPIIWDATRNLEMRGFEVRSFTADGATPNRRFYRLHQDNDCNNMTANGAVYWSKNVYAHDRNVYFFSDPPHLIKTLRNNLENSDGHMKTRMLKYQNYEISWGHVSHLYENDLAMNSSAPGLRLLPKLSEDHIYLSPPGRMKVNLAVQVLSSTVANALALKGMRYTKYTEEYIRLCDKFFDCLNVTNTFQGQAKNKPALYPYRSVDDPRFLWLKSEFLGFFENWKKEVDNMQGVTKEFASKMCISHQTIEGLQITVHSFVDLVKQLLAIEVIQYFLSDRLNQDVVEEHFGRQRLRGGCSNNPTVEAYGYNERKIIVAKSEMIRIMHGNTRGRLRDDTEINIHDERKLPTKKKKL